MLSLLSIMLLAIATSAATKEYFFSGSLLLILLLLPPAQQQYNTIKTSTATAKQPQKHFNSCNLRQLHDKYWLLLFLPLTAVVGNGKTTAANFFLIATGGYMNVFLALSLSASSIEAASLLLLSLLFSLL